jgi:uncharacterized OsmC-like protein
MVKARQDPLYARYRETPGKAWITDHATASSFGSDPFHGVVVAGDGRAPPLNFGIHRAIGGDHDLPNPGDLLCASLAACLDATLRMIAGRMNVELASLEVSVSAFADVRGCLMVDRGTPVGFQRIEADVHIKAADGADPAKVGALVSAAERSCVILQTLRSNLPIEARFSEPAARGIAEQRIPQTRGRRE